MTENGNCVYQAILSRRSIRRFEESKPVEDGKIDMLLRAAMAAPSACNIQPWEFIVVTDSGVVDRIRKSIRQYADYNAPALVVVCGSDDFIPWKGKGALDCAMAMENMMILAPSLGLGTVCIGGFDAAALNEILGIPDNVDPVGMLYLGYPAEEKEPRTRYLEEAVHRERFDAARARKPRPGNIIEFGPEASI